MDLTFRTVDGDLKENGDNIDVTIHNLEEYVERTAQLYLKRGIQRQMDSFIKGFNQFVSIEKLQAFMATELDILLCGTPENLINWTKMEILENAKFLEGYSVNSTAVEYLLNILLSFNIDQRRSFLQFLTGSPRLPVGGWRSLNPKFTIVRKKELVEPDKHLPTANTCFFKLKLPDYSSEEKMREKLLFAMDNGQSFGFD